MKVIRQKRGYTIRLSDSEFEALELLVMHGIADSEGADDFGDSLSPTGKRALNSTFGGHAPLAITEDRRSIYLRKDQSA